MIDWVKDKPRTSLRSLKRRFNLDYDLSNISKILKKAKLPSRVAAKKQELKPLDRSRRLAFALAHANTNWSQYVFSDEKTMQSYHYGRVRIRRPLGQRYNAKYVVRYNQRRRFKVTNRSKNSF